MAWLESHQSLGDHPKTKKAARLLGIPEPTLIGHLMYLWWWAIDFAEDGDVTRYDATDLAMAARWDGDAEAFVAALIDCRFGDRHGFLERAGDRLVIHDWWVYAGKLIERRRADAARKRDGRHGDVHGTSDGRPADGAQTAYVTNQPTVPTNPDQPTEEAKASAAGAAGAGFAEVETQPAEDTTAPGHVYALVDAFAKATKRAPSMIQGRDRKEAAQAFNSIARETTTADLAGCVLYLRSDPFWREPGRLTARKLAQTIPEWIGEGRPAAVAARASPSARNGGMTAQQMAEYARELERTGQ